MERETLLGGAVRLRAGNASFVVSRLRPGVLLVKAAGRDDGQFGSLVVNELAAELSRFPPELEIFVDARAVVHVASSAASTWTHWFERHRDRLRRIQMLTPSRQMQVTAAVAGHHSRTKLVVHTQVENFESACARAADGQPPSPADGTVVDVRRTADKRGVVLEDGACWFEIQRPNARSILLRLTGPDRGSLSNYVFDEMVAAQGRDPLHVFVDLREATMPSPAVSELWASWFAAHQKRLASVLLLATTKAISVATRIARFRSRTGPLIAVVEQPDAFAAAIARVTTG